MSRGSVPVPPVMFAIKTKKPGRGAPSVDRESDTVPVASATAVAGCWIAKDDALADIEMDELLDGELAGESEAEIKA